MDNPYLEYYEAAHQCGDPAHAALSRHPGCIAWSFAVPNDAAIQKLVALSPILEMGAGTGYWGWLVQQAGGCIDMFDIAPPGMHNCYNMYGFTKTYAPVKQGTSITVEFPEYKDHTLLLCWPSNRSVFAEWCLKKFQGQRFVYVGEHYDGCCATPEFFERIAKDWVQVAHINIPQWWGCEDAMWVYERRQQDGTV